MIDVALSSLALDPALSILDLLETPVAIFSIDTGDAVFANASALAIWNASSLDALHLLMNDGESSAITELLVQPRRPLRRGERRKIVLPSRTAPATKRIEATCTGISLHRPSDAVLVEFYINLRQSSLAQKHDDDWLMLSPFKFKPPAETQSPDGTLVTQPASDPQTVTEEAFQASLTICPTPTLAVLPGNAALLQANSAARRLLQISTSDLGADNAWFADEKDKHLFFENVDRSGSHGDTSLLVTKSGRTFLGALSAKRLVVEDRDLILVMIQDIDGLQRSLVELESALRIERDFSHRQRRLLEVASHEFRTPLAVIDSAAQRIMQSADTDAPERIVELAERVREFARRMGSLIDNTIDRAKNNAAEIEFAPQPDRFHRAITQVAKIFEENADIELAEEIADLPEICFDTVLIEQAFVNLFENAAKYSLGRASIRVSAEVSERHVALLVRDWGIGIMPEDYEHVFAENTRGRNVGGRMGTGLGLYIVDTIMRLHGGKVSVEHTDGPGTTLKVTLPLCCPDTQHKKKQAAQK